MLKKYFPDNTCFACVFLTVIAATLILIDTTGVLSLVGVGIGVGLYLANLLLT